MYSMHNKTTKSLLSLLSVRKFFKYTILILVIASILPVERARGESCPSGEYSDSCLADAASIFDTCIGSAGNWLANQITIRCEAEIEECKHDCEHRYGDTGDPNWYHDALRDCNEGCTCSNESNTNSDYAIYNRMIENCREDYQTDKSACCKKILIDSGRDIMQ